MPSKSLQLKTNCLHLLHFILSEQHRTYSPNDSKRHQRNYTPTTIGSSSSSREYFTLLLDGNEGTDEVGDLDSCILLNLLIFGPKGSLK